MANQTGAQYTARIRRNRRTPRTAARRETFRDFWRGFSGFNWLPRRKRRRVGLQLWRQTKHSEESYPGLVEVSAVNA